MPDPYMFVLFVGTALFSCVVGAAIWDWAAGTDYRAQIEGLEHDLRVTSKALGESIARERFLSGGIPRKEMARG